MQTKLLYQDYLSKVGKGDEGKSTVLFCTPARDYQKNKNPQQCRPNVTFCENIEKRQVNREPVIQTKAAI